MNPYSDVYGFCETYCFLVFLYAIALVFCLVSKVQWREKTNWLTVGLVSAPFLILFCGMDMVRWWILNYTPNFPYQDFEREWGGFYGQIAELDDLSSTYLVRGILQGIVVVAILAYALWKAYLYFKIRHVRIDLRSNPKGVLG